MILIFTGNGKGKTTAALGHAVRALGYGKKVLMIQFVKGQWQSGEELFNPKSYSGGKLCIIKTGRGFVKIAGDKLPISIHKKAAEEALKLTEKEIKSKKWDLVILDEINVAVKLNLIKASDVLKIINKFRESPRLVPRKSAFPNLILTGRGAPKSFMKIADLVTEMKEIKHPFQKGIPAKKGIDF